jgi:hypothetical protein
MFSKIRPITKVAPALALFHVILTHLGLGKQLLKPLDLGILGVKLRW